MTRSSRTPGSRKVGAELASARVGGRPVLEPAEPSPRPGPDKLAPYVSGFDFHGHRQVKVGAELASARVGGRSVLEPAEPSPRPGPDKLAPYISGLVLLFGVFLTAAPLSAQPPEEEEAPQADFTPPTASVSQEASDSVIPPSPRPGMYHGPVSCASATCHGSSEPRDVFDVLQNEYLTWLQLDRHSKAHEVLAGPESRKIAQNLGLSEPAESAPLCLECHAFRPPEDLVVGHLEPEEGISCEACHGPASGWLGPHTEESWTKQDGIEAGLIDLSDPVRRGELCLSCHRGDETQKVDHRLIAAGHPQLVFELDNFSGDMPSHWRADPQADGARGWALGQVVALREELELVAATAAAGHWPELSLMTCDDCHHSLRERRWLNRGVRRPVGLPAWSPAKWAVTRHVVRRFAPDQEASLDRALDRLARNVSQLGSPPSDAAVAAREAHDALLPVLPAVQEATWDDRQIRELLRSLAEDRNVLAGADRDTALQAFLAVNSLASDLIRRDPTILRGGLIDAVEALHRTMDGTYEYRRDAFATGLERLGREVRRLR